ncbi:MAG: hypothetical protein FJ398_16945 [Verrucomicrobia bacterium]|nr:hypothetical protein [Verrucomicrobiota bacterium]
MKSSWVRFTMLSLMNQGRASPSRRAAPRAWNTCDSARWDKLALPSGSWKEGSRVHSPRAL